MSEQVNEKTLGQVGFEKYGDTPGAHGPCTTFDGRNMPRWDELKEGAGKLTKERWEAAAEAIGKEYMRRHGLEWDDLAKRWRQPGATGPAVNWHRQTGA